jgi:hypothetical protein
LLQRIFRRKQPQPEALDPNPVEIDYMPYRPYRVLDADLPFYSDPECRIEVQGARLVVLQSDDPRQKDRPIEPMPSRKRYREGELVGWDLNNKKLWETCYYRDPASGAIERAWSQAVEFIGPVVRIAEGALPGQAPQGRIARDRRAATAAETSARAS